MKRESLGGEREREMGGRDLESTGAGEVARRTGILGQVGIREASGVASAL